VPEAQAGTVLKGQAMVIDVQAIDAHLVGRVETIAPEIDPASQMLFVEGKIDARAGVSARVAAGLETRVHLLSSPRATP